MCILRYIVITYHQISLNNLYLPIGRGIRRRSSYLGSDSLHSGRCLRRKDCWIPQLQTEHRTFEKQEQLKSFIVFQHIKFTKILKRHVSCCINLRSNNKEARPQQFPINRAVSSERRLLALPIHTMPSISETSVPAFLMLHHCSRFLNPLLAEGV